MFGVQKKNRICCILPWHGSIIGHEVDPLAHRSLSQSRHSATKSVPIGRLVGFNILFSIDALGEQGRFRQCWTML